MEFVTGMLTSMSLIVVIGAQNAYVLRQGIRREHVVAVASLCAVADAVLIVAGVAGIGALVERAPALLDIVRTGGVIFLLAYAAMSLRRAFTTETLRVSGGASPTVRVALATAAALTFLNPHVYLDTVILLGSIANQHGAFGRWIFAAGAATGSIIWFFTLGFGARTLAPLFARPRAWQVLDVLIAVVMVTIAALLAVG